MMDIVWPINVPSFHRCVVRLHFPAHWREMLAPQMCVDLKRTFVSCLAGNRVCLMWLQRFRSSKEKHCDSLHAYTGMVLTDLDTLCMASHSLQTWKTRHETRWEIVSWCLTVSIFQALMNFCWPFWHRLSSRPLTLQRAVVLMGRQWLPNTCHVPR